MDPISAAFATYLEAVSSRVTERMTDVLGTEVQAIVVQHNGINVPYSYQIWKIRPQSVCGTYRQDFPFFSKCTVAAQSLFRETCGHLQANPQSHWKHQKLKNMYCDAAVTYQPSVANVEWSEESTPIEQARSECNLAVAELMSDRSSEYRKKKDEACGRYHALQGK